MIYCNNNYKLFQYYKFNEFEGHYKEDNSQIISKHLIITK